MANHICKNKDCGKEFVVTTRGRPPALCVSCRLKLAKSEETVLTAAPREAAFSLTEQPIILPPSQATTTDEPKDEPTDEFQPLKISDKEKPLGSFTYEIMITNTGYVYRGNDEKEARKSLKHYNAAALAGFGQVGHEKVSFYISGALIEYFDPYAYIAGKEMVK